MVAKKNLGGLFDDLDTGTISPLTSVSKETIIENKEEIATTVEITENKDEVLDKEDIEVLEIDKNLMPNEQVEIIDEDKKQEEYNEKAIIYLQSKNNYNKKKYANFYLRESTLAMINKIAGKGKGKSGYNKSELVDVLLEEALSRLKVK